MVDSPAGYAVIDVETTGLRPSWRDRVVEIGVVHVDLEGRVTGEWGTLVNPERDLGPQHIHGISASDVRHAPKFKDIAGTVLALLRGRVPAAHNLGFDAGFLQAEFDRTGVAVPSLAGIGVCTMAEARRFLPDAPRNLAGCCAVADVPLDGHHDALIDARAAAGLLCRYLEVTRPTSPWPVALRAAVAADWPAAEVADAAGVRRGVAAERQDHFLARVLDRMPQTAEPVQADRYLALLDQVLLDHHISAAEADALVELATALGLCRTDLDRLHGRYLAALARAALADGVVTDAERDELGLVAGLLRLPAAAVRDALNEAATCAPAALDRFTLRPGDLVVFTGEMEGGRDAWELRARDAGCLPHGGVTKKVRLVVAADPDTLSGKARKARAYGIPIVTPEGFARILG
ncbi:exonuclease domain-containing protein [Sphaerisporangium aureirubrum]|uniref:Exonuclease domain-containing protein n=1 Tax=Sphaerisporangium aureirubrum TaxID=1544736 RepID=A0ABW1NKG0_9ACTN